jgi:hypothetical protein
VPPPNRAALFSFHSDFSVNPALIVEMTAQELAVLG